jgi:hypothetical protein
MNNEREVSEKPSQDKPIGTSGDAEPGKKALEHTVLAGSEGEELIEDLLADIDVMYTYARRRGISLSPGLLEDISRLMALTNVHREMAK